jgi:hypothetical protein
LQAAFDRQVKQRSPVLIPFSLASFSRMFQQQVQVIEFTFAAVTFTLLLSIAFTCFSELQVILTVYSSASSFITSSIQFPKCSSAAVVFHHLTVWQ